jgi:hypothetical protein
MQTNIYIYIYIFVTISRSVLLRMRNVGDRIVEKRKKTHFVFNYFFFVNRVVNEIMWKNIVEPNRRQLTIWRARIACWMP